MHPDIRRDLTAAIDGLLYPSDTDAPFELVELSPPFPWEGRASAPATDTPSEVIGPRQFFGELLQGPDAAAYQTLWQLMAGYLDDLRVDRLGKINIEIYVTGVERLAESPTSSKQNRVGLKTHAVET